MSGRGGGHFFSRIVTAGITVEVAQRSVGPKISRESRNGYANCILVMRRGVVSRGRSSRKA